MHYYSLNNRSVTIDFKQATIEGQAPDRGLYFPSDIPIWSKAFCENLSQRSNVEIAFEIMLPYIGTSIPEKELMRILEDTLSFDFPLRQINEQIYTLELFHGPTLAFKDLGARFLSRCLGYFAASIGRKITVLVATSGDTGGAVADAFYQVEGTEVIILYPSGKVSPVQEKQLTTMGGNIYALEVAGDFDDCQHMVKMAFADKDLKSRFFLTSANSINISRWLSQQIYYAIALKQWHEKEQPIVSVPSGNFGNLCAGLLAQRSGLEIDHFIAACNKNDVFTRYVSTGLYEPNDSHATISNAMDVGNPSNVIRILELFKHQHKQISHQISSESISDDLTAKTIKEVYQTYEYIMDPHTAVAYAALKNWIEMKPSKKGIILSTAHPVKFPSIVEKNIGRSVPVPSSVETILGKEKRATLVSPNFAEIKDLIIQIIK